MSGKNENKENNYKNYNTKIIYNNDLEISVSQEKDSINQSLNEIYSKNENILLFIKNKINEFLSAKKEKELFGQIIKDIEIIMEKNAENLCRVEKEYSIKIKSDKFLFENLKN